MSATDKYGRRHVGPQLYNRAYPAGATSFLQRSRGSSPEVGGTEEQGRGPQPVAEQSTGVLEEGLQQEPIASSASVTEEEEAAGESLYQKYSVWKNNQDLIESCQDWYEGLEYEQDV
jgi:hypothetical protein